MDNQIVETTTPKSELNVEDENLLVMLDSLENIADKSSNKKIVCSRENAIIINNKITLGKVIIELSKATQNLAFVMMEEDIDSVEAKVHQDVVAKLIDQKMGLIKLFL